MMVAVCDIYKAFYGRLHNHTLHTFTVHVTDVCKRTCVTAVFNTCYGFLFTCYGRFINERVTAVFNTCYAVMDVSI